MFNYPNTVSACPGPCPILLMPKARLSSDNICHVLDSVVIRTPALSNGKQTFSKKSVDFTVETNFQFVQHFGFAKVVIFVKAATLLIFPA